MSAGARKPPKRRSPSGPRPQGSEPLTRYALLAQEARDIVLVVGQGGRLLEANRAAITAYGYTPAELLTLTTHDLRALGTHPLTAQQIAQAHAAGILFETVHRRKDGSTFPVEVSSRGMRWGRRRVLLSLVRGITERVEAQRALRLSEARFGATFRASPDGITLATLSDGRLLEVNDSFLRLIGFSREEVIGRSFEGLGIWLHPEDRARLFVQPLQVQGAVRDLEVALRPKVGEPIVVLASAEALDIGGDRCLLTVLHDITKRKRAEEALREREAALQVAHEDLEQRVKERTAELSQMVETLAAEVGRRFQAEEALRHASTYTRSLIEASLDPLVTIGPDGTITDVNAATEAATGYARRDLIGTDFSDYFTEPEKARAGYEQVFREGAVHDYALELRHRDGHIASVLYNASVYRDEAGKVIGVFAAARDITERKRAEEDLRRSREELRALAAHLESVREEERVAVAKEVHDVLGQGLAVVKFSLAGLAVQWPPDQATWQEKSTELATLLDDLIRAARRLFEGMHPSVLDLLGVVTALREEGHAFQARTGITCQVTADMVDLRLNHAQATALFRICQEGLSNVAQHAHATRVSIRLRQEARRLVLEIVDNGRGVTDQEKPNATAFGLIRMRERAVFLGGDFAIVGQPGAGTTVTVTMPLPAVFPMDVLTAVPTRGPLPPPGP